MAHPCSERIYHQYVFMMRNRDDDYDIPPTVVATTSDIEEAIDIMIDAEQMIYQEKKVDIIRKMGLAQLYMINDDILVWKTQSRQKHLIIWNIRQYLTRRVEDEFMSVWKAFRRYMDYVDNGCENDMEPTVAEQALMNEHMPYQKFEYVKELTIADLDDLYNEGVEIDEEILNTCTFDMDDEEEMSYTPPHTSPPTPPRPSRKRYIETRFSDSSTEEEDYLSYALKQARLGEIDDTDDL